MLMANNMLEALSKNETTQKYTNNDTDFVHVLELFGDTTVYNRKIRCSDGQERTFSFGN